MKRVFLIAWLALGLGGCSLGRYWVSDPAQDRILRVEQGDRYYFSLEEPADSACRWSATSNDKDVEVLVDHDADDEEADVRIRIHRGFDGPAEVTFRYGRKSGEPEKIFVISCFRTTWNNDSFWK